MNYWWQNKIIWFQRVKDSSNNNNNSNSSSSKALTVNICINLIRATFSKRMKESWLEMMREMFHFSYRAQSLWKGWKTNINSWFRIINIWMVAVEKQVLKVAQLLIKREIRIIVRRPWLMIVRQSNNWCNFCSNITMPQPTMLQSPLAALG